MSGSMRSPGRVLRSLSLAGAIALAQTASATSLSVSPTLIDVVASASAAASFRLRGGGADATNIQVRVFRWRQEGGEDVLEPTDRVAVSPPFATIRPKTDYVVRVVRTSAEPVVGEESYRVIVDELPAAQAPDGNVNLAVRHSIPVFFRSKAAANPDPTWGAIVTGGTLTISVANTGGRRLRVAALRLVDDDGVIADLGPGLAGYALAKSGRSWRIPVPARFSVARARVEYVTESGRQSMAIGAIAGEVATANSGVKP